MNFMMARNMNFFKNYSPLKLHHHQLFQLRNNSSVLSPLLDAALTDSATTTTTTSQETKNILKNHSGASRKALVENPVFKTKNLKVSPWKLNHLARVMRGMTIEKAQSQMRFTLKKRGRDIDALLHRAASNLVHNFGESRESVKRDWIVKAAWIGKGVFLKRIRIHGRGRTGKMTRPFAHLKIMLEKPDRLSNINLEGAVDPMTGNPWTLEQKIAKNVEFVKLVKIFKREKLFMQLRDTKAVRSGNAPWSSKGWKYVTNPKWIGPENAFMKYRKNANAE